MPRCGLRWLWTTATRSARTNCVRGARLEASQFFAVFDKDFTLITRDGRDAVFGDPTSDEFPWYPKPVGDLKVSPGGNDADRRKVLRRGQGSGFSANGLLDPIQERIVARFRISLIFGFFQLGKVQNFPAGFSSSELSAHQMAPSGVIAHSSSHEVQSSVAPTLWKTFLKVRRVRLREQRHPEAVGWAPLVWQARWLPPFGDCGSVASWRRAMVERTKGGATQKPTVRHRGLTHNSRASIPKRTLPNCHSEEVNSNQRGSHLFAAPLASANCCGNFG